MKPERIINRNSGIVDLAKLFEVSEGERRPRPPAVLAPHEPPACFFPPAAPGATLALSGTMPLAKAGPRPRELASSLAPLFESARAVSKRLTHRQNTSVVVPTIAGVGLRQRKQITVQQTGTRTIRFPAFLDRYISAAALKQFAGMPDDTLLRKRGADWEIVQDHEVIDLSDRTETFSIGAVTMLS